MPDKMKNIPSIKTALAAALLLFSVRVFSAEVYDPDLQWRTLTTGHFQIHYHQGIEPLARRLCVIAEEVHSDLQPRIKWQPASRTHVVLVDNTDSANGYSTPFPVNKVVLYVSRPEPDSVLGNYSDWLRMVFTHEYTHTLNLDMVTGCCAATRVFPGRVWFPSIFQPIWLLEGNAVYHESRSSGMGRNNSTWTDMVLRTEIYSGTFKSISLSSHYPRSWPGGNVPYLYGGLFVEYLEKYYGIGGIARVYLTNSDNKIPYQINGNAREVYGRSFSNLWREWQLYSTVLYGKQIESIKSRGLSSFSIISDREERAVLPRFNSDGSAIYYIELSAHRGSSLMEYSGNSGNIRRLCRVYDPVSLAVSGSSTVFLSDAALYRSLSYCTEAYKYDGDYRRITKKLRGKYIDVGPDGKSAVYSTQNGDRYSLILDSTDFDRPRPVISDTDIQITGTRFSPDGKRIAFSIKDRNGYCYLMVYSVVDGGFIRLTSDRFNDTSPCWHPEKTPLSSPQTVEASTTFMNMTLPPVKSGS